MRGLGHIVSGDPQSPALVFLHGFLGTASDWEGITSDLSKDYYCIAVDLPGHGSSTDLEQEGDPVSPYSFAGTARAIETVINTVDIKNYVLIGYSMGARIALDYALRMVNDHRCASLILEGGTAGLESTHSGQERFERKTHDEKRARELEALEFSHSGNTYEDFLRRWYEQPLFHSLSKGPHGADRIEHLIQTRRRLNSPHELAKSLRGLGTGEQLPLWTELHKLIIPVCFIAGQLDTKYVDLARRMTALCKAGQMAIVPDAGHNVHLENPSKYLAVVREFLAGR